MGSWRRQGSEICHQELKETRLQTRKPPLDDWHCGIPSWEKKFCSSVGLVPWKKLLETKKYMHLYDNVVKWNDSAGEEAFHNAKSRFWAKINGLSCNISLPDPDIHIDDIDWNSSIDPDLLLDLEREPMIPVDGVENGVVGGLYDSLGLNQSFGCTGWGEAEEEFQESNAVSFRAECANCDQKVDDGENSWEMNNAPDNVALREKECDENLNNSFGWNDWQNNHNESNNGFTNGVWRTWDGNSKNTGGSWCSSTFKTSRFHGDGYRKDYGWRNRRGRKRVNFAHEPHASESWNHLNSSGPVSYHGSSGKGMHGVGRNQFCEC